MSLARSLHGLRVLDLSRLLPGPFLTMVLADLGADVVKVEDPRGGDYMRDFPPRGEGMSGRYLTVNRNKRSVTVDLKDDRERDRFLRMAAKADVVVESFRPGVMERLGVGYEALRERNEAIILCSISGYGQTGPYRDRAGHDINYLALAGVLAMSGATPDGPPAMAGVQIADMAGGAMWGAVGILCRPDRTGPHGPGSPSGHFNDRRGPGTSGQRVRHPGRGSPRCPPAETALLNGGAARYGVYRTSDGRYLSVGALEPQFLKSLAAGAGLDLTAGAGGLGGLRGLRGLGGLHGGSRRRGSAPPAHPGHCDEDPRRMGTRPRGPRLLLRARAGAGRGRGTPAPPRPGPLLRDRRKRFARRAAGAHPARDARRPPPGPGAGRTQRRGIPGVRGGLRRDRTRGGGGVQVWAAKRLLVLLRVRE